MSKYLNDNQVLKVVIVGHVDHGKSSLIGRLMSDLNQLPEGKVAELKSICKSRGVEFEYAFLLDALQEERDQGITIDTTQIFFKTKKRNCVFIDAPGHREFIKNMITGAASADIAILIVDVNEGIKEQTKKHAYLLKLLGLNNVITVFNKMDKVKFDENVFKHVKAELDRFLQNIGVKSLFSVPISAKLGDNIVDRSKKMEWYKKEKLVEILDNYKPDSLNFSEDLRFPVQDIYKHKDQRVIVGRIETGKMKIGDKLLFLPSNEEVSLKSFVCWPKSDSDYKAGDCIGITLDEEIYVDKGNMVSLQCNPPNLMNTFEASIFWLSEVSLDIKRKYLMKINTGEYSVNVQKVKRIINTNDLGVKKSDIVKKNDVCELVLHSAQLVPMDDFKRNSKTGRFCILDEKEIVGGGIINLENYPDQREQKVSYSPNIIPTNFSVSEVDRTSREKHRPAIIWLTGLSGSGKSTIAKGVEKKLFLNNFKVFTLDGDNLRMGLNKGLSFSPEDRTENIRRTAEVAKLFSQAGFIVLVSLISPYKSERKKARDIRPEIFKEIFIKASVEECSKRDVKGLYAKAKEGIINNFTGISSPYEEPETPDLILNTENENVDKSVDILFDFINKNFVIFKK